MRELPRETPYKLPPIGPITPPRWDPPQMDTFELSDGGELPQPQDDPQKQGGGARVRPFPAALVIPNSLAVLHQFFAVTLMVTNGAPAGSSVDASTASPPRSSRRRRCAPSSPCRPSPSASPFRSSTPPPASRSSSRRPGARRNGRWRGCKPGTHTVEVEVNATYKSPGQADFPLKGTARASVVIHDPRFNMNFSHPDTVRKDIEYSTYSFITNMSGATQNIKVDQRRCRPAPTRRARTSAASTATPDSHDLSSRPARCG